MLLHKRRRDREVLTDVDGDVVGVYRVLRDPATAERLRAALVLTPFSRDEFEDAWHGDPVDDEVERARRLIVRGAMSFGTGHLGADIRGTGFRDYSGADRTLPAHDFSTYPAAIPGFVARFRGVLVEQRDAVDLMRRHDCARTLHYVDPPYVRSTRGNRRGYVHDLDDAGHARLLDCLRSLRATSSSAGMPRTFTKRRSSGGGASSAIILTREGGRGRRSSGCRRPSRAPRAR